MLFCVMNIGLRKWVDTKFGDSNMKQNKKDTVRITCYGQTEVMERSKAIAKYKEGMLMCEGSEAERYTNIYYQLIDGETECSDEIF